MKEEEKILLEIIGPSCLKRLEINGVGIRPWNSELYLDKEGVDYSLRGDEIERIYQPLVDKFFSEDSRKFTEDEEKDAILFVYNQFGKADKINLKGEEWNEKIISFIGKSQKDPVVVFIGDGVVNEFSALSRVFTYGIYSYKGEVYILYLGLDSYVNLFSDFELEKICKKLESGDYVVEPTYQG